MFNTLNLLADDDRHMPTELLVLLLLKASVIFYNFRLSYQSYVFNLSNDEWLFIDNLRNLTYWLLLPQVSPQDKKWPHLTKAFLQAKFYSAFS